MSFELLTLNWGQRLNSLCSQQEASPEDRFAILVAPYCAIPRDYLSDTPLLRAMGFLASQHGQLGAIPPPPPFLSVSPLESIREVEVRYPPLKRGISAILARYPMKTREERAIPPSAILSRKGIARYGGVSRIGPLSSQSRDTGAAFIQSLSLLKCSVILLKYFKRVLLRCRCWQTDLLTQHNGNPFARQNNLRALAGKAVRK